jgi:hypothetical protein
MSNQLIIDSDRLSFQELDDLLAIVERAGGAIFTVRAQWIVEGNDAMDVYALEKLLKLSDPVQLTEIEPSYETSVLPATVTPIKQGAIGKVYEKAVKGVKPGFALKPGPEQALKSWRVLDANGETIETLTVEEKIHRLNHALFAPGTILHHPKAGKMRVTNGSGLEPVG